MKFKKMKAMILALTLVFSSAMVSGCSIPFIGNNTESEQPADDKDEEDEGDKEKDEEETEDKENVEIKKEDDGEEGWEAGLTLPGQQKEDGNIQESTNPICTCKTLCTADTIDNSCPVCTEDFHRCIGVKEEDPLDAIALPDGQTATATIVACGSNFLNNAAINGTDKSYKYDYMYEKIKDTISGYDVKIATQETIFTNDPSRYSGSTPYMTPPSIASALANAGFNVIASATDHSFDNGKNGVLDTLNAWNAYTSSTLVSGLYASEESYNNVSYMDVNGIRVAFLSYTSGLNGMTLTNEERIYVKTLYDEDSVANDIAYASKIADFVVVLPHWGSEGVKSHTENQEKWAQVFVNNGADLIIGTGSDYLQDVTIYDAGNGQVVPCYYSLGNLISGKDNPEKVLSGAATITITKTGKSTKLENYGMFPIALHVSKKGDYFQSYVLSEYSEDTIKWHNLVQNGKKLSVDKMQQQYDETIKIEDINSIQSVGGSSISIGQQQVTTTNPVPNTEQDNGGNPLVDDGNVPETSNPSTTNPESQGNGLGGLQVIGG